MTELIIEQNEEVFVPLKGGQSDLMFNWSHRYVALEGGWGSGKTISGAWKLLTLHIENAIDDLQQPTGVYSAMVADTLGNVFAFDVPAIEEAADKMGLTSVIRKGAKEIVYPDLGTKKNESKIFLRSAERGGQITGWEVGAFLADEPARWKVADNPKDDAFIQIRGRLRHPRARFLQGIYTYTNEGNQTNVFRFFREPGKTDRVNYRARTKNNPHVAEFYQDSLGSLPPSLVEQYLEGGAAELSGSRAYSQFDDSEHITDVEPVEGLTLALTLDFNIDPGMHALICQHSPGHDAFAVTHEIHAPRMDLRACIAEFARIFFSLGGTEVFSMVEVFADATGSSEWEGTSESLHALTCQLLEVHEIPFRTRIPRGNPFVVDRVTSVNAALGDVRGVSHLSINRRCQKLIDDLTWVRYDKTGKGLDKADKSLTHASDSLGYMIHYLRPVRRKTFSTTGGRVGFAS